MNDLIEHLESMSLEKRLYLLKHISEHLYAGKLFDYLFLLARQEIFLAAQAGDSPETLQLPLGTIQNALKGAIETDEPEAMAEFVLSHSNHLRDVISEKTPSDACKIGDLEYAWKLADLGAVEESILWHLLIIWQQKDIENLVGAKATLDRLLRKELVILPGWYYLCASELLLVVLDIDKKAFYTLSKFLLDDYSGRVALVENLVDVGQIETSMRVAKEIKTLDRKRLAYLTIGLALSRSGDHEKAREIFTRTFKQVLKDTKWEAGIVRDMELLSVIQSMAKGGFCKQALSVAKHISIDCEKVKALCIIAQEQIHERITITAEKTLLKAKNLIRQMEITPSHAEALAATGQVYAQGGKHKTAKKTFERALGIKDSEWSKLFGLDSLEETFEKISEAQARAGFYEDAVATTELIEPGFWRDHSQDNIKQILVESQVKKGQMSLALEAAYKIKNAGPAIETLIQIARVLRKAGNNSKARDVMLKALQVAKNNGEISEKDSETNSSYSLSPAPKALELIIPIVVASVYISAGEMDRARNILEMVIKNLQKCNYSNHIMIEIFIIIGKVQTDANLTKEASKTFEKALCLAKEQDPYAITRVAQAQAEVGQNEVALEFCAEAIDNLQKANEEISHDSIFELITKTQVMVGESAIAMESLQKIKDDSKREDVLIDIAEIQARTKRFLEALFTASYIEDPLTRSDVLKIIAKEQLKEGLRDLAVETVNQMRKIDPTYRTDNVGIILKTIVSEVRRENRSQAPDKFASTMEIVNREDFFYDIEAMTTFARALTDIGEIAFARKTLLLAVSELVSIGSNMMVIDFCETLVDFGDYYNALKKLILIKKEVKSKGYDEIYEKAILLARIGYIQAKAKDYDAAHKTITDTTNVIKMYDDSDERVPMVLAIIGLAQATEGDYHAAEETFASAIQIATEATSMSGPADGLLEIAKAQVRAGLFEDALKTADAILTYRNTKLPEIAGCFAETGADAKEFFKRLLIPCSYYRDSARKICYLLLKVYPEKTASISGMLSGVENN